MADDIGGGLQLAPAGDAPRAGEQEVMTVEAIERDPWNAITLDLPANETPEFYGAVIDAAKILRADDLPPPAALSDVDPALVNNMIKERWDAASNQIDALDIARAWAAPEFSRETIAADPWTAVFKEAPENAGVDLLIDARRAVEDAREMVLRYGLENLEYTGPKLPQEGSPIDHLIHATQRMHDFDIAINDARAPAIEAATPELQTVEPAPAVTAGAIEPDPKAVLAEEILFRMSDMHSIYGIDARDGGFALVRSFEIDDNMLREYGLPDSGEQELGWAKTLPEMHDRIIAQEGPFYAPELVGAELGPAQRDAVDFDQSPKPGMHEPPDHNFRPASAIEAGVSGSIAAAVEDVLGEITSLLVPDQGVTPEQARDLNRAHEERIEARIEEGARLEKADALDAVNTLIVHNQARDMPGSEVKNGETVYDRYPGLTRERFVDNDTLERAFDYEPGDGFGMKL